MMLLLFEGAEEAIAMAELIKVVRSSSEGRVKDEVHPEEDGEEDEAGVEDGTDVEHEEEGGKADGVKDADEDEEGQEEADIEDEEGGYDDDDSGLEVRFSEDDDEVVNDDVICKGSDSFNGGGLFFLTFKA
jgi:hypothetical protein